MGTAATRPPHTASSTVSRLFCVSICMRLRYSSFLTCWSHICNQFLKIEIRYKYVLTLNTKMTQTFLVDHLFQYSELIHKHKVLLSDGE